MEKLSLCRFIAAMSRFENSELLKQLRQAFPGSMAERITIFDEVEEDGFGRLVIRRGCPLFQDDCRCFEQYDSRLEIRGDN